MAKTNYLTAPVATTKMPFGIPYILVNEAGERFSFYGTRCILVIFMTTYLLNRSGSLDVMTPEQSKAWFHLFVSAVYFTPIIGALLSDIWLGKYRTILYFSILYCIGFFALAFDNTRLGLGIGLTLIAIGSGIIKPCVSANVGDQFGQNNKYLIDKIYRWFYFAINFGAFFAILLNPLAFKKYGPHVAFGIPAVLMVLATVAFWLGRKKFVHVPPAGLGFIKETFSGEGLKAVGRLFIIYIFIAMFWSLYDQMDSSWVLQAEKMNRHLFIWELHPSQLSAVNAFLIMVLIPIFSYIIYPGINKIFPLTALRKIGIGMFVIAFAFVISAFIQTQITAGERPSIAWLLLAYVPLTSAEIMVSITGLEFSYTQAPKKMKSFIMSIFLLSTSLGNAFTALVNTLIQNPDGTSKLAGANYFWFFASLMAATAVVFIFVARTYQPKTYIQDESSK